ncbi:MAG: cytochrome c-type biogenesis protein, partial [Alphaproteobacteria bacterium]
LGDDNVQVVDYVVARYGEYVRLKPSFRPSTYPLWLGPPIMGFLALMILFVTFRSRQHTRPVGVIEPLSPADRQRLDALVEREIDRQEQSGPDDRG